MPELEAKGAVMIYVDLWSDIKVSPATLVYAAVRRMLADLVTPASTPLARLRRLRGLDLGGMGFRSQTVRGAALPGPGAPVLWLACNLDPSR